MYAPAGGLLAILRRHTRVVWRLRCRDILLT